VWLFTVVWQFVVGKIQLFQYKSTQSGIYYPESYFISPLFCLLKVAGLNTKDVLSITMWSYLLLFYEFFEQNPVIFFNGNLHNLEFHINLIKQFSSNKSYLQGETCPLYQYNSFHFHCRGRLTT